MQQNRPPIAARPPATERRAALTFLLCAVYFAVTLPAVGIVSHVIAVSHPGLDGALLEPCLNLLVLFAGFLAIARSRIPELRPLSALGLVLRPSAGREATLGAAIGWGIGLILVLPAALTLRMHCRVVPDGFHLGSSVASLVVLLLYVLARQLVLCGLPFQSLARATSPLLASVAFAGIAALLTAYSFGASAAGALFAALAQLVFCMAAARTRALWLGGTLQLAWGVTTTLLFGLPSFFWPPASGIVRGHIQDPRWLTGGAFGPEASLWAIVAVLVSLVVVWRLTRDYAWHYTYDPVDGAGYPMDVAPPAEHTRMEEAARTAVVPLVQIGGAPPSPIAPVSHAQGPAEGL